MTRVTVLLQNDEVLHYAMEYPLLKLDDDGNMKCYDRDNARNVFILARGTWIVIDFEEVEVEDNSFDPDKGLAKDE